MRFSSLSIGVRVAALVLYFGLLALWIAAWTGFVNWLPQEVVNYLAIGGLCLGIGYLLGARFR